MHATEFLADAQSREIPAVVAMAGADRFLRQQCRSVLREKVLGEGQMESVFSGKSAVLSDILDELSRLSMFGDRRLVVLEDADDFVSEHRTALEKYVDKPARKSVFVIDAKTWNKSTRLAKAVEKTGLTLVCDVPKPAEFAAWISKLSQQRYGKKIASDANELLRELVGDNLGIIEQELSKLAGYVGERTTITAEDVRTLVGGWKVETTWKMIDAVRDGNLALALELLQNLYRNGEHPLKILGGINFTFRKLIEATESARQGTPLEQALRDAKVFPYQIRENAAYLKRIGFTRAERLRERLISTDSDLKGRSKLDELTRMELLLVELSGRLSPQA